jgi:hypothetical protein
MKKTGIFIILVGTGLIIFTIFSSLTKDNSDDVKRVDQGKNPPRNLNWFPMIGIGVLGIGALVLKHANEKY